MIKLKHFFNPFFIGLAIFAMYFGAGNIAFPINMGRASGFNNNFAIMGMLITSVFVPFLGLISLLIIHGNYKQFFGVLGRTPGFLLTLLIMGLLGPFGATPRCLALSYTTFSLYAEDISSLEFGIIGSLIIFIFSYRKNHIMNILGKFLTPLLLLALTIILIVGIINTYHIDYGDSQYKNVWNSFYVGMQEGSNTMDLFGSFFFSIIIFPSLKNHIEKKQKLTPKNILIASLVSSTIAMSLLAIIYYGMSFIASHDLIILREVELSKQLGIIATLFLGQKASIVANLIVSLACLTTAITLVVVFTEFLQIEIFKKKISYLLILILTIVLSLIMGQLGFSGIVKILKPILLLLYPMLIVLSMGNILKVFLFFNYTALISYVTFFLTIIIKLI